eukprot:4014283-Karenia_brevis.AAC.1
MKRWRQTVEYFGCGANQREVRRFQRLAGNSDASSWHCDLDKFVASLHCKYGHVLASTKLPRKAGEDYEWQYVCPIALMQLTCERSLNFTVFLEDALRGGAELVIYADEFTPGNVLRPDKGRQALAIYWSLNGFPSWWQARNSAGWFYFGLLATRVVETLEAEVST